MKAELSNEMRHKMRQFRIECIYLNTKIHGYTVFPDFVSYEFVNDRTLRKAVFIDYSIEVPPYFLQRDHKECFDYLTTLLSIYGPTHYLQLLKDGSVEVMNEDERYA